MQIWNYKKHVIAIHPITQEAFVYLGGHEIRAKGFKDAKHKINQWINKRLSIRQGA